jgi:cytochrome c554/c'-like protein
MRLHLAFASLVMALVAVAAWAAWRDATPEWRTAQRALTRREIARLEAELASERAALERPEVRYELERIDRAVAAADTGVRAAERVAIEVRLERAESGAEELRRALREAEARLREPALDQRRRDLLDRLEDARRAYAQASGVWPPDTLRLSRLWAARDSLAAILIRIEGPAQSLRDRLMRAESETEDLRIAARRLGSARDSLLRVRARIEEPVTSRSAALARLRSRPPRIREIVAPDGEPSRCPTCHGALGDAPGSHPALAAADALEDVPCTACHRGRGRALTAKEAHRGLFAAGDYGAGPGSIGARIERLASRDPLERERAREELWALAGVDPVSERATQTLRNPDSTAARAWAEWWEEAASYFEPGESEGPEHGERGAPPAFDPWRYSTRGRPLRYVGSQRCLSCHEVLHREHSRRWMATKFRSIERLAGERDPARCFPCHTTGYDAVTGVYAEPGVTCEACHGPGERYSEMMAVGQELLGRGEAARGRMLLDASSRIAREAIDRRLLSAERGEVNVCVSCHQPWQHREGGPGALERESPTMAKKKGAPDAPRTGG